MQFTVVKWKRNVDNGKVVNFVRPTFSKSLLFAPLLCGEYLSPAWFANTKTDLGTRETRTLNVLSTLKPSIQAGRCIRVQAWAVGFWNPTFFENCFVSGFIWIPKATWHVWLNLTHLPTQGKRLKWRLIGIRCGGPAGWTVPCVTLPRHINPEDLRKLGG